MRRFHFVIWLLHCCLLVKAQDAFRNISYAKALKLAVKENKLVFLQYESETCIQCNDVADKAFKDKALIALLSKKYIAIKVPAWHTDREQVAEVFNLKNNFGTLYIDKNERLVYHSPKTSSSPRSYYAEMETVESKLVKLLQVDKDEKDYFERNKKDIQTIRRLIQNKSDLGQHVALLLTEYISLLPEDSVNTIANIQFIAKQAPLFGSKAYLLMRRQSKFNEAWYAMPGAERREINSKMFNKSIKAAAAERDEQQAKRVAHSAMGTTTSEVGKKNLYDWHMMNYYLQTKEHGKYLPLAAAYYDRLFARITPKEIYNLDSLKIQKSKTTFVSARYDLANQMQRAASRFYALDTDSKYTDHSLHWVKRSIDLNPNHNNKHLYAQILYRAGKNKEAIKEETEAILLSKQFGSERKEWYSVLEKMKRGEIIKDIGDWL